MKIPRRAGRRAVLRARRAVGKRFAQKKPIVSASVKQYVQRQIHSSIENKSIQINGGNNFGNVLESPDFNAYPMCPLSGFWGITQGVGQGNRVGNQVKTRKCYLSYVIRPTPYDATSNAAPRPMEVQLMLGYVKNTPSFAPAGLDIQQLFQSGSSATAPVGSLRDIISVINKDYWVIKKRWTHKIGFAQNSGTGSNAGAQFFSNNDFKLNAVKRIDITQFVPATYQFNDNAISPTSKNLFFMYYAVAANGAILTSGDLPTNIEFWVDYHYEDA